MGVELPQNLSSDVMKVEEAIKKRICIGNQVSTMKLIEELDRFTPMIIEYAIHNMVRNGDLREVKGRKQLVREK